ncbi:MAG: exodeoxyribonuclease III [Ruminococcaceae bacterium]|nr:exodeoxyribonuclease III [Oscillospiraceae bacterium]
MKFISWNVNGFRACLEKGFEEVFKNLDADFFAIQESKMQPGQADFAPQGYCQYWYSADKKGYSGTAVFAKKEPLSVRYGIGVDQHDHEGRAITLEYENFYLLNVYTPNAQRELARLDYRMQWEDALRQYIKTLDAVKPVIYCGDLNCAHNEIDLKNPKTNRRSAGFSDEERAKFTQLLDSGFTDTFRYLYPDKVQYSWWSYMRKAREKDIGWRIDYFVVSNRIKDKVRDSFIFGDILGSDHCPVGIEIDL